MYSAYLRIDGRVKEVIGASVNMFYVYLFSGLINAPKILIIVIFILYGLLKFKKILQYDCLNDEYKLGFMKFLMFTSKYITFIPGLCKYRRQEKENDDYSLTYSLKDIRFGELEKLTRNCLLMVIITTITFSIGILL